MFYAIGCLEILIPQSRSLKEKRSVLGRLKSRVENRFHCSVAEVDHQDLWQRSAIGVAVVVAGPEFGRNALEAIRREVEEDFRLTVSQFRTHVARLGDEELESDGDWDWSIDEGK